MKNILRSKLAVGVAAGLVISGCATDATNRTESNASKSAQTPPSVAATVPAKTAPQLKVVINCSGCNVADTVPGLVLQGYQNAAKKVGKTIGSGEIATLTITEYSQRPPAARALFGAFAGKDRITARVDYKDQNFTVSDYYANAWQGMNALSERIGEMAFERLNR